MGNKDFGLYSCGVPRLISLYPTNRLRGTGDSVRECNRCKGDQKGRFSLPSFAWPRAKATLERRGRHALPRVAGLGISRQKLGDALVLESRLVRTSERYKISPHQQRESTFAHEGARSHSVSGMLQRTHDLCRSLAARARTLAWRSAALLLPLLPS